MRRLTVLVIAGVVLGGSAIASAQTWTLSFPAGAPTVSMTVNFSFQVRVTNTGTTPISYVSMPFPSGYGGFGTTRPANWNVQVTGTNLIFRVNKSNRCTRAAIAPGASATFTITTHSGRTATDSTDAILGSQAGTSKKCATNGRDQLFSGSTNSPTWVVHGLQLQSLQATPSAVDVGQAITVTATFKNNASAATDLNATGTLQTGGYSGTLSASTATVANANGGTGTVRWTFTPSTTGVVTFKLAQVVDSTRTLTSVLLNPAMSSNAVPVGDLGAVFALSPASASNGDTVTLTETVFNASPSTVQNVVPVNPPANGIATSGTATITRVSGPTPASVANLGSGQNTTFTWKYTITGMLGQTYTFTGSAQATLNTRLITSNVATISDTVSQYSAAISPLALSSGSSSQTVTLTVTNTGSAPLHVVQFVDTNTSLLKTPSAVSVSGWSSSVVGGTVTWTSTSSGNDLQPGASLGFPMKLGSIATVTLNTTVNLTATVTPASGRGSAQSFTFPLIVYIRPADTTANFGVAWSGGTGHAYWSYNDIPNAPAHTGAMVVAASTSAAVMDSSVKPQDGTVYSVGATLGTTGATVVAYITGDDDQTDDDADLSGLPTSTSTYLRFFQIDNIGAYSAGTDPPGGLQILTNLAGDGRVFSYSIGYPSLSQAGIAFGGSNGGIYAGTNNAEGALVSVQQDGEEYFRPPDELANPVQAMVFSVPFMVGGGDDCIVVADEGGNVTLIDSFSGVALWQVDLTPKNGDGILSTPAAQVAAWATVGLPDDLVFVGTSNSASGNPNTVSAIGATSGSIVWQFTGSGGYSIGLVNGALAVDYNRNLLYVGSHAYSSGAPTLWALNTVDGSVAWSLAVGDIDSDLSYDGADQLYVYAGGQIQAVDLNTHAVRWGLSETVRGGSLWIWGEGTGNALYYSTGSAIKKRLDTTGSATAPTLVWQNTTVAGSGMPVVESGVYAGSNTGVLYKLDSGTGALLAQRQVLPSGQLGVPSVDIVNGRIYVGSLAGQFVAYPLF